MSGGLQSRNLRRYALVPLYPLVWPFAYATPRRRGLWLFACSSGFKDNPRYLFEHVVAARPPGVRPVWFAQTEAEASSVRAAGYEAVYKRLPKAWWLQLRAGLIVLGFGPSELNRPLMGRAKVVQTWHGAPFKRIHADFPEGDELIPGESAVARLVNAVIRWGTNLTRSRVDLIPSQSPVVASRYQSAFQVGPAATPVVGTPRADIIGRTDPDGDEEAAVVRRSVLPPGLQDVRRLVLYAPTWRDGGNEALLAEGFDGAALDRVLEEHDAAMVIKLHPQGDVTVFDAGGAASARRILVGTADGVDVNVLLRGVDLLLTDYSAISVDFALLGRPIVYFMPDLAQYEGHRGMYEPPSALTGGLHCSTWDEVRAALDKAFDDPTPYSAAAEDVRDRYWAHRDTEHCARITAELLRLSAPAGSA